jgi:hypothetical protein
VSDLRLVGFEELSAGALRERLLAARELFWAGAVLDDDTVRGLHDPLFFHQLGGFGAVALTADDQDAGYLLGVVSADRRAAQAVAAPSDEAVRGLGRRLGAHESTSPGHAGPGADRVLLTRPLV